MQGLQPNQVVYTAVISACLLHKNYDKAWDMYVPESQPANSSRAVCLIVRRMRGRERPQSVKRLRMPRKRGFGLAEGGRPGLLTDSTLFPAGLLRRTSFAHRFGEMRYWNVDPDDITYNTMIDACAKVQRKKAWLSDASCAVVASFRRAFVLLRDFHNEHNFLANEH